MSNVKISKKMNVDVEGSKESCRTLIALALDECRQGYDVKDLLRKHKIMELELTGVRPGKDEDSIIVSASGCLIDSE